MARGGHAPVCCVPTLPAARSRTDDVSDHSLEILVNPARALSHKLDRQLIQALKSKAHGLRPTVIIGAAGLSEAVLAEADQTLTAHELIKVKLPQLDKEERTAIADQLCNRLMAHKVQQIGRVVVLYRPEADA
ncbi:MAG: ribosome assembly RNA-binding protein YhbY [Gammaproteobacteria bacterium]|nr:ribosome assembly RNA-binding protein YhbY [Gammaproteobacteria bacterium]